MSVFQKHDTLSPRVYLDTAYRADNMDGPDDPINRDSMAYHDLRAALTAVRALDAAVLDKVEETCTTDDEHDLLQVVRIMLGMEPVWPCDVNHDVYDHDCAECGKVTLMARRWATIALKGEFVEPEDM